MIIDGVAYDRAIRYQILQEFHYYVCFSIIVGDG